MVTRSQSNISGEHLATMTTKSSIRVYLEASKIKRENFVPTQHSYNCPGHFTETDFKDPNITVATVQWKLWIDVKFPLLIVYSSLA
ncbi:hypothetical protein PoB_004146300 [Plakobranchus ocellatus]|uniref:Uncharacterized protein n=1 Tax=Plakobranchus ocellatus TaxID=259542 RepID=A0AAV4B733_9GAST|nr:hypothetical protein PoB_004146300 [Plakobranchus ocellatus]